MPASPVAEVALSGARVFDGERIHDDVRVVLRGGTIAEVGAEVISRDGECVQLDGGYLVPGFIDLQVNGGGGVLFNDQPTVDGIAAIATAHRRFGTTGLLPTLISDDWAVMQRAAEAVRQGLAQNLPGLRGIHFEGPYLNPARRGVHRQTAIRALDRDALELFSAPDLGAVVVTLAPEMVGTADISSLSRAGVRVCAGHTAADYESMRAALAAGLAGFTHLFNGMAPLAGRSPGAVAAALLDETSCCGIIVDGHHVHPANLRLALKCKEPGGLFLVTDAMPCIGATAPGFQLDGNWIAVDNGRCTTADGTLAGSALDMAAAVRNAVDLLALPLSEALRMASLYPAAFLGQDDRRGRIAPGYVADLVLLDERLHVRATWIDGVRMDHAGDGGDD